MRDFKDLEIWKKSIIVFEMMITDANKFPRDRIAYNISDQVIRSISSISANIAEGYGRGADKEFHRYCIIAKGSLNESRDWIYKLKILHYITDKRARDYEDKFYEISKMLNVFMSKIRIRLKEKLNVS